MHGNEYTSSPLPRISSFHLGAHHILRYIYIDAEPLHRHTQYDSKEKVGRQLARARILLPSRPCFTPKLSKLPPLSVRLYVRARMEAGEQAADIFAGTYALHRASQHGPQRKEAGRMNPGDPPVSRRSGASGGSALAFQRGSWPTSRGHLALMRATSTAPARPTEEKTGRPNESRALVKVDEARVKRASCFVAPAGVTSPDYVDPVGA